MKNISSEKQRRTAKPQKSKRPSEHGWNWEGRQ
jgi:hypothetical protein